MTGWILLGTMLALQAAENADAGAERDPCPSVTHGPAVELTDLRPVELDLEGSDAFEGDIPTVDIADPCGLRFTDLSGVWTFNGYQAAAYHDLRTGRFRMRLTHVPYDSAYFETWELRFGYPVLDGVIGPDAEEIALSLNDIHTPNVRNTCPEQYQQEVEYLTVALDYDLQGRPRLTVTRPRSTIDEACVETLDRFVTDTIVRTGVERAP
ncbi:MAG: hypothetical protein GC188_01510 [Alphaproteobacteria bacterium]|nr:hypothetical protein [Alphaproteobacteria bacterium]